MAVAEMALTGDKGKAADAATAVDAIPNADRDTGSDKDGVIGGEVKRSEAARNGIGASSGAAVIGQWAFDIGSLLGVSGSSPSSSST